MIIDKKATPHHVFWSRYNTGQKVRVPRVVKSEKNNSKRWSEQKPTYAGLKSAKNRVY